MGLEAATFISQLDNTFPLGGDPINKGDDHVRLLKSVLQSQFPNFTALAVNPTSVELNLLVGLLAAAAELNILDGALLDTAELNTLNGITATTAELNVLAGRTLLSSDDVIDNLPAGTLMCFQQTAAPTGWTKQVTHNDKALRVVSGAAGSAGTDPFTTIFGSYATDDHTLTEAQMPSHVHQQRSFSANASGGYGISSARNATVQTADEPTTVSAGSDGAHQHNIDLRVQYVDLIIASKD